jgi:hypothetical protein
LVSDIVDEEIFLNRLRRSSGLIVESPGEVDVERMTALVLNLDAHGTHL